MAFGGAGNTMRTATKPTTRTVMAIGASGEYDENGNETYFENSDGYWYRREYDEDGKVTYYEDRYGTKRGTKRGSCSGKVVEIDGKKYKLTELC
jgi:hypothetical protein